MCIEVSSLMKCPYIIFKIAGPSDMYWESFNFINDNNVRDTNQSFE